MTMTRVVLWAALGCAVLLALLAVSRGVRFTSEPARPTVVAPAAEETAEPAAAEAPRPAEPAEPAPEPPPLVEPDLDLQVQEDAAAVGMTTREPRREAPPVLELPPPRPSS